MVGRYDVARCGPCGCAPPPCTDFAGAAELLDQGSVDDWSTSGSNVIISAANVIRYTSISASGALNWRVQATFTFSPSNSGDNYLVLIGDMADEDNFYFLRYEYHASTGPKLILNQRSGGAELVTPLSEDPYVTTGSGGGPSSITLDLCWIDGILAGGVVGGTTRQRLQVNGLSPITGGGKFGVFIPSLNTTSVTVSAFEGNYGANCAHCGGSCCAGVPVPMSFEIVASSDNVEAPVGVGSWKFCKNIGGGYTLPHTGLGDGDCKWQLVTSVVIQRFNSSTGLWEDHTATMTITKANSGSGPVTVSITYLWLGSIAVGSFIEFNAVGSVPLCNLWNDWIDMICNLAAFGCCCGGTDNFNEGCVTGNAYAAARMMKAA